MYLGWKTQSVHERFEKGRLRKVAEEKINNMKTTVLRKIVGMATVGEEATEKKEKVSTTPSDRMGR